MPVRTTKEVLRDAIENLPTDVTVEEAIERLRLLAKIECGLEQADSGDTLTHEEARRHQSHPKGSRANPGYSPGDFLPYHRKNRP